MPTGDDVPEQAMLWGPARCSFQELGSAPGSAPPHPPQSRNFTPGRKVAGWGGSWAAARERAAPPRAVSSPCRAPPGAVRPARGGRASQVEARRPARPAAARACPVLRPPQGPGDTQGWVALRRPGVRGRSGEAEQGSVHTPPHLSGLNPDSIPTMLAMSFLVADGQLLV